MRLIGALAGFCVATTMVAACGSGAGQGTGGGEVVDGGTFTFAMPADPGNLDPQASAASGLFQISQFSYDRLLNHAVGGKVVSGLATSWKASGKQVVLTMHKGITCADGAAFTAADVAANLNYVTTAKNQSPFLGVFIPAGTHTSANVADGTVTITTPKIAPFVLEGLANIPMVCSKGLRDRKTLAAGTDGTGPYKLVEAVSGDHYTYAKRDGYTWGPGGIGTDTKGLPDTVVVKIIQSETTTANLLLSGQVNAATIIGADASRLEQAHLFSAESVAVVGEMWFNQVPSRSLTDKSVRLALTRALDLGQIAKVVTAGRGTPGTSLAAAPPTACGGNSVASALPSHDLEAAGQLLDTAGWRRGPGGVRAKDGKQLALTFVYSTALGSGGSAGAELATQVWKKLGVNVTAKAQDDTALTQNVFGQGDWDITWLPLNVASPDQLVPFMSGAVPPAGTNFAHITNAAYSAGVAKASAIEGAQGCAAWLKAESNLISAADVIPFANQIPKTFGNRARFDFIGDLVPTSIRMLAS